ncbi:MAG TPA: 3-dehydroquinate synthase II [Candidatus Nanoarchaeia archaeon]|nr:3-dehydroquinate synthase II [Candidatus Nanoarchaeia archaeon]
MKELWVQIDKNSAEKDKLSRLATELSNATIERKRITITSSKQEITLLDKLDEETIKELKRQTKPAALKITIQGKEDENAAVQAAELGIDYIVINCLDWRVIPLENLIARISGKSKLIAEVTNAQDAQLVLETLELGTDGVLLKTGNADELAKTAAVVKRQIPKIPLIPAKILTISQIGTGARVCVDTCDLMEVGEGMLVGSQSAGLFLVEAEVHENPYVASRPFRINAGPLSMYTLGAQQNTQYLSELKAGDEVLIVNREGKVHKTNVGRTKTEMRPLLLIEAEVEGRKIKTILQNAETIRLVTPKESIPVTALKKDDEVLVHITAKGGRHFGISVPEEKVIER